MSVVSLAAKHSSQGAGTSNAEPSSLTRIVAPCLIEGKIMNSGLSKEAMSKLSSQLISS